MKKDYMVVIVISLLRILHFSDFPIMTNKTFDNLDDIVMIGVNLLILSKKWSDKKLHNYDITFNKFNGYLNLLPGLIK